MKYYRLSKWNPISKGYPDDSYINKGFFVTVKYLGDYYTCVSTYEGNNKFKKDDSYTDQGKFKVIAWMPLVKPYEEK